MQISYYSALTKIQKLQNFKKKKKKKNIFLYWLVHSKLAGMLGTWPIHPVFKSVRNFGISIPVQVRVQYQPPCSKLSNS